MSKKDTYRRFEVHSRRARKSRKKHSTAFLIRNVLDANRFDVGSTVWPQEVMQGQNSRFSRKTFSAINRVTKMTEKRLAHHRVCLIKARRMIYNLTSKGQIWNLTSGQGHDLTQIGHIAYHSIRIDETNTMDFVRRLYLFSIKSYCSKTVGDLRWPRMT